MGRYKVVLYGTNFLLNLDGDHGKFCFHATRLVKSTSAQQAERIAIIRIYQELNQSTHIVKNTPDAPRVTVEKVETLGPLQFISKRSVCGFDFQKEAEATADQSA